MKLEIHLLQNFPPANLNRDENGMPKSTVFGGRPRARISSQCQKRAVRLHYQESARLDSRHFAFRSRAWLPELQQRLVDQGIPAEKAALAARLALGVMGAKFNSEGEAIESDIILFLGRVEIETIATLLLNQWEAIAPGLELDPPQFPKEAKLEKLIENSLKGNGKPGDIALFGRMMASLPTLNVDAAVQMAHAISVNSLQQEFDYFTAVDDLEASDDSGADHLGETGYNSSAFYRYTCVDVGQLLRNLTPAPSKPLSSEDEAQMTEILGEFCRSFIEAVPKGHQNSFAAHTRPALALMVLREGQPLSLADAFEKPVIPGQEGVLHNAVRALDTHWQELQEMYGARDLLAKGVALRNGLRTGLTTLGDDVQPSVEALVDHMLAAVRQRSR